MKKHRLFIMVLWVVSAVVAFASYATSRGSVSDQRLVDDIGVIQSDITTYEGNNNQAVPDSLSQLNDRAQLHNPYSTYTYQPMGTTYRLCATFKTDNTAQGQATSSDPTYHKAGYQCFDDGNTGIVPGGPMTPQPQAAPYNSPSPAVN